MANGHRQTNEAVKPAKRPNRTQNIILSVIVFMLFVYLGLSFLAPVLMKQGYTESAKRIYKLYRPVCHQLAYRAFFLFGEQVVYPRDLAGMKTLKSYEAVTGNKAEDLDAASALLGNETMGYKVVLCQRDTAIFAAILIFAIVFLLSKKRLKALPWWLWILLGLVPIGLDGFWQLISQLNLSFLSWLPARESTPLLRVLTGFGFGFFSAWFIFPSMYENGSKAAAEPEKTEKLNV